MVSINPGATVSKKEISETGLLLLSRTYIKLTSCVLAISSNYSSDSISCTGEPAIFKAYFSKASKSLLPLYLSEAP
jgi:hypothetical protein